MACRTYVVLGDLQIPFQDQPAVDLALSFIDAIKPTGVVLNGDIVDCYSISDFDRNPMQKATLADEIDQAGRLMRRLSRVPEKVWIGGNHEDRLRRFVWRNPGLAGVKELAFPKLFHLGDYGFRFIEYGDSLKLGKLSVTHGDCVRSESGATARAHFDKFGSSVMVSHTHRGGVYYRTSGTGVHAAYENFCLCRLDPEYVKHPNWQQGFSVVHVGKAGYFSVQQLPILPGPSLFYGPKQYGKKAA